MGVYMDDMGIWVCEKQYKSQSCIHAHTCSTQKQCSPWYTHSTREGSDNPLLNTSMVLALTCRDKDELSIWAEGEVHRDKADIVITKSIQVDLMTLRVEAKDNVQTVSLQKSLKACRCT